MFVIIDGLLLSRQGAVDVEEEEREIARQRSAAFQGTGFKLGDSEGPSVMIGNRAAPKQEKVCDCKKKKQSVCVFFDMIVHVLGSAYVDFLEKWVFSR